MTDQTHRPDIDPLLVSSEGGIVTLTLNRPDRKNALTTDMVRSIIRHVEASALDNAARVIVIRAAGADFCTGIDLVESNRPGRGQSPSRPKPRAGHLQRGFALGAHRMIQAITSVQLPVVSAVQGWAAGIGNALALSADFTVGAISARFWVPFVTKGFTPDSGTTWLLPRLVGLARAKEMILLGRPVEGSRAAEWGLITQCVPDAELDAAVASIAGELASMATTSIGLTKALLHGNLESGFAVALQNEGIYEELGVRTDDFKEGMRAFAEKRKPDFTGW